MMLFAVILDLGKASADKAPSGKKKKKHLVFGSEIKGSVFVYRSIVMIIWSGTDDNIITSRKPARDGRSADLRLL